MKSGDFSFASKHKPVLFFCFTEGNVWQQCMEATVPETVEHGKLCCSHDTCDMWCDPGFYPSDDPLLICKVDPADDSYKWFRWGYDMNGEEKLVLISEEDFPECQGRGRIQLP